MIHAIERARERYNGLELTVADLKLVGRLVREKSPRAFFLGFSLRFGTPEFAVYIRGRWVGFVTTRRGSIITVLPRELLDPWEAKLKARGREVRSRPKAS